MNTFKKVAQTASFILFLALLSSVSFTQADPVSLNIFSRLDPALMGIAAIAGRSFKVFGFPALIVMLSMLLFGRAFCGHICPMGATVDFIDKGVAKRPGTFSARTKTVRFVFLAALVVSAVFGMNFSYGLSPLSLSTRFYGLVILPMAALISGLALDVFRPLTRMIGWQSAVFSQVATPVFPTQLFLVAFFAGLVFLARFRTRFFCRFLCPAGALFSIFARKPLLSRRIADSCTGCGKCARACPMAAIPVKEPSKTLYYDCILCGKCEKLCPTNAVSFGFKAGEKKSAEPENPSRRRILAVAVAGTAAAVLPAVSNSEAGAPGASHIPVRPPGSVPEDEFLARCARCGLCMAACSTNTLRPLWLEAGVAGLFSPGLNTKFARCDPKCTRCGHACPTGAIRPLSNEERPWVKIGTAKITKENCLAWAGKKACMTCDEVCPYDAIKFFHPKGHPIAVPRVKSSSCAGCGACESACPVKTTPAIRVTSEDAVRLSSGSYKEVARDRGYDLDLAWQNRKKENPDAMTVDGIAPGFDP